MAAAQKTSAAPLPAKLANLLREARWLVLAAVAGYLLLIFLTFHKGDPGWSLSATAADPHNAGGRAGAWIADLLLYLFGVSAYWWIALCLVAVAWGYRSLDRSALIDRRPLAIALGGFALLLLSSAALEALRLHTLTAQLPLVPGGMLGGAIGVAVGLAAAGIVGAFGTPVKFSFGPVLLAFSCAFATGLVFGYMPARKAALVDPIVALAT